jgi:hypothetical protein
MIAKASPALKAYLAGADRAANQTETNAATAFDGAAIRIDAQTLERWKAAYRHIDDWPAALQAIDDFCASIPAAQNPRQISRASSWLERRNHENRNDSEYAIKLRGRSF